MAGIVVTGAVSLRIDPLELEASIQFIPSEGAQAWSSDAILKLLSSKGISPLPSAPALEGLLKKWQSADKPVQAVVARGVPPDPSTVEQINWMDLPVPDEIRALAEERLQRATPPELFRIKIEKIKHETVVKKPGALPFLPPKEETLVNWEQKEIKERVYVDANIREILFADRNTRIATIMSPKPGKPGKNVFGRAVAPQLLSDKTFYHGQHIRREKNEFWAERSGIVRVGDNWADIIPLSKGTWTVYKGEDGATCVLDYEPADKRLGRPVAHDILFKAMEIGMAEEDMLSEDELDKELEKAFRTVEPLEAFPLVRRKEALAAVEISSDHLKAVLHLRKAMAGAEPLTLAKISSAIKESGIKGFSAEAVKAEILTFYNGDAVELSDYILVEGRAPERGEDRKLEMTVAFLAENQKKPILERLSAAGLAIEFDGSCSESDNTDALELLEEVPASEEPEQATTEIDESESNAEAQVENIEVAYVVKGDKIAFVNQPPAGASGMDVFGKLLPGLAGNDPLIELGDGLRMSRNEIICDADGVLVASICDGVFRGRVLPYKDSDIQISVRQDSMCATVTLFGEEGAGVPLTEEDVMLALKNEGVVKGIDEEAVKSAVLAAKRSSEAISLAVAWGQAPVAGGSTTLKWLIERATGKAVRLLENGKADFKNQDRLDMVQVGTPLAEIVKHGDDGSPGWDVFGKILQPHAGQRVELEHDETITEESLENGVRLIAAKTGELSWDGKNLKINETFAFKGDIGAKTGNIKFPGEVKISGKVNPGFAIIADKDVLIGETVEAALISAGGRIVVAQGVLGAGKAILRARSGIDAGFVEQATLLAVEDIRIKNGCLQSNVKTNGKLQLLGDKGHLIGGICHVRMGLECANLGTERGTRTEISFGQDYLIMDQIQVTERESEKIKNTLSELDRRIQSISGNSEALDKARAEKVRLMKLLEQLTLRLFTLREKFEEHHHSEITVRGMVFPGVVMESHGRYLEIKQKKNQLVFEFDRALGRIQEKPLKKG